MAQKDMPLEMAKDIIYENVFPGTEVNLQGEGEPVLSKNFWPIVKAVISRGGLPYIITNAGYTITPEMAKKFKEYFRKVYVSLDTTDTERAKKIGRFNVAQVMGNILKFKEILGRQGIGVVAVGISKSDIDSVARFASRHDISDVGVQSLQTKDDYMINYQLNYPPGFQHHYHFQCRYLQADVLRFFNVDGIQMPCCFIKDTTNYVSAQNLRDEMSRKKVPKSCSGCRHIRRKSDLIARQ